MSRDVVCALQVVLKKAQNQAEIEQKVNDKITEFAQRGFRSLGVALAEGQTGDKYGPLACSRVVSWVSHL